MDNFALPDVFGKLDKGYLNQWELITDLFRLVDRRLYLYYKYHRWLGPDNDLKSMLGLVVSREEFEEKLNRAAQTGLCDRIEADELSLLTAGEEAIAKRLALTSAGLNLTALFERFSLDEFERNCVILAYVARLDGKYERLFAYLQDDITKKAPTAALAVQLFIRKGSVVEEYISFFSRETAFTSLFEQNELKAGNLCLRPAVAQFLSAGEVLLPVGLTFFDGAAAAPEDPLVVFKAAGLELDRALKSPDYRFILLTGPQGSGKRFQIKHLMARHGRKCLFVDARAMKNPEDAGPLARLLANLLGAYICFSGMESKDADGNADLPLPSLLEEIAGLNTEKVFLTSYLPVNPRLSQPVYEVRLPPSTLDDRVKLLEQYLPAGTPATAELASKFKFTPAQIKRAARQVAGISGIAGGLRREGRNDEAGKLSDEKAIHRCFYGQVAHRLDKLAARVPPQFTWDDVVLPLAQKKIVQSAVCHIKYQHKVFCLWDFDSKISYGRGLSILFSGAPGTGKTMCAQILAGELNMELYKINISQVVSKYIGETEKNLHEVFKEARNSSSILFFDECDALFGKRGEVKDAHDRNANIEVAYLLQQIEEHDGVCVLASNLAQNIDAAFMRRITYVAHFPFPDAAARREIYLKTVPGKMPLEQDIDWDFIAEKFPLSGGHIKNIVLSAAFAAAADDKPMGMRHLLTAAVREMKKHEIVVVREQLKEYSDLLET